MFCLDTNVVIAVIGDRSAAIRTRLREEVLQRSRILLPVIVLFELRFGIAKSARRRRNEQALEAFLAGRVECPAFDEADAAEAAEIRAFLERNGTPIGPCDTLIAAQARRRGAILVTGDVREFRRVPALTVQDWA
ncbi:MAG: PIN domain-containing protein [Rhodospirillales bacterium]|nr:PIN domain-containing protein [Rhodospirillales bacterium]